MPQITEAVLRNAGGEIGRYPLRPSGDPMGYLDAIYTAQWDREFQNALRQLAAGDTISIEERWTEEV